MRDDGRVDRRAESLCHEDAAYVLGVLSPGEAKRFGAHLDGCARCREAVAELAAVPGVLALLTPEQALAALSDGESPDVATDVSPPPPPEMLTGLLSTARRIQRHRRWVTAGSLGLAAACAAALILTLALSGNSVPATTTATSTPPSLSMQQTRPGPVNASLQLTDKAWGTAIVINCEYGPGADSGPGYELVMIGKDGREEQLGSWGTVPGPKSTINTATAVFADDIAGFEIRSAGTVILRAEP